MSSRYKIKPEEPIQAPFGMEFAVFWDPEWEEYQVDALTFGKPNKNMRYHTPDREDAFNTAKKMAQQALDLEESLGYRRK